MCDWGRPGLIPASFLTPDYDITFSHSADGYKQRRASDRYNDFKLLPGETEEDIFFFGGRDYLQLFADLTSGTRGRRTVYYRVEPGRQDVKDDRMSRWIQQLGCTPESFVTPTRTNWHYGCASRFVERHDRRC